MNPTHEEFFEKLVSLCGEYNVIIEDSGSLRKGIQVIFSEATFEKFDARPRQLKVFDENGSEHLYI